MATSLVFWVSPASFTRKSKSQIDMKGIILSVFLATLLLSSQVQGNCFYKGENLKVGEHILECTRYTCHEDGHISAVGCPVYRCKEQIGYRERDVSKPYPDCCEGPICRE